MLPILLGQTLSDPRLLTGHAPMMCMNTTGLLRFLETYYALGAPAVNRTALRTEQYRQVIAEHLAHKPRVFYARAFQADQLATAEELLSRRDELLEGGWNINREVTPSVPERLRVTLELERMLLADTNNHDLLPGVADRLRELLAALEEDRHPRLHLYLNEPRHLMPPATKRLLERLEATGDVIEQLPEPTPGEEDTDLSRWQASLRGAAVPGQGLRGDGSLVLLRAARETHLAAYIARTLRENDEWRPAALLTVRNQTLDNAMVTEGLPSMGVPSNSLARPSLQVLKLITAFLWEPVEVEKIMEFVSLVTKPLHWRLGQKIALFLADTPGMFGPRWVGMIEGFFRDMKERRNWPDEKIRQVREQYEGWFRRRRYGREEGVPKNDLRFVFIRLREWALEERTHLMKEDARLDRQVGEYSGLLVLYAQAQRAVELLDAQPERNLAYLDVERLVRTVYEPAPAQFQPEEKGALSAIFSPGSALRTPGGAAVDRILWWDFIEAEPDYFFSRYYPEELDYLHQEGALITTPKDRNRLSIWQQSRPVLHARKQLVLCLPDRVDGAEVEPHLLLGDLEAAFAEGALNQITIDIDLAGRGRGIPLLVQPKFLGVPLVPLDQPVPHVDIPRLARAKERDFESPTALEDLMFYPYKWVFRHQLELRGAPILSIASEGRLRGNLAHRMIEQLLRTLGDDIGSVTKPQVGAWIDANEEKLFRHQGAVLLQYGQEPERVQFVRTMKKAAWALVHAISNNGWRVRGSEELVQGAMEQPAGQPIRGRADLLLARQKNGVEEVAVVDLKWAGKTVFENLLKNDRDVQLALYSDMVTQNQATGTDGAVTTKAPGRVHTAYFVIRSGKMMSRNQVAFTSAQTVGDAEATAVQQDMIRRIRNTYNWRWEQLRAGRVEVRCEATAGHLEDAYLDMKWEDYFEMETGNSRFDDYQSLIGLVR